MAKAKRLKKNNSLGLLAGALAVMLVVIALSALLPHRDAQTPNAGGGLRLSEIMASNETLPVTENGGICDWLEIANTSDAPINLKSYTLMSADKPSRIFAFPGDTLAPGEFVIVCADGSTQSKVNGVYHAPFKLPAAGGTVILLKGGNTADTVDYPALKPDQVYALDADGTWEIRNAATPGVANPADGDAVASEAAPVIPDGALEISEAMSQNATYFTDENGAHPDYIELHNRSGSTVDLSGWYLSNSADKLRRWKLPSLTLDADGYLAIHCSGENRADDPAHLHTDFRLSSNGDDIYLTDPDGATVAHVRLPALAADQAYSLTASGWSAAPPPSPGYANTPSGADSAAEVLRARNALGVYITEVMAAASHSDDWIELYNDSNQAVDLSGFGLSDNAARPRKWCFPSGTVIQPGAYLGAFANGKDDKLQTSFRLSAGGGYSVTLSDASGAIFDRIYVPQQYEDISYGRMENGLYYLAQPTPGQLNAGQAYTGRTPMPVCSVKGGLYRTGDMLSVEISAPPNCRVYYTLDNTDPTEASTPYSAPISVSASTILRVRAYQDGCMPSFMDTQSYLFDAKNGGGSVYVVSVVSDPYNLTSDEAGIMVKGNGSKPNYMQDWEREAHVEIFDREGGTIVSQECCIRQQGQTCRAEPQQCFKLIARSEYGDNLFRGHIFSKRDYDVCHAFMLRNSSDDAHKVRMRDSVLTTLAEDTSVLYQETEVCVAYLNGVYWGHYNIREVINTQFLCQREGWEGDEDKLDLVRKNSSVVQGSDDTYVALIEALKQYGANSDTAYQAIDSAIDIQNYIEYMAIQIFIGNTDPSNIRRYRNANADGKWRWTLFDVDWAFNQDTNSVTRWLTPGGVGNGKRTDNTLFILLMQNDTFRDQFLTHLGQELATTFSSESVLARFEARYNVLKTILPDHFERWNESEDAYNRALKKVISFAKSRPTRMLQFLKYDGTLKLTQAQMEHYFGDAMQNANLRYDQIQMP